MYKSKKSFWIGLSLILSILIIVVGFIYLKFEVKNTYTTKGHELEAIARLKSDQVANWIADEMFDANAIAQNKLLINRLEMWRVEPTVENKQNVTAFLKTLKSEHGYEHIFMADEKGNFLISSDDNDYSVAPYLKKKIAQSLQLDSVVTTDLYECPVHDTIHIDFIAPVSGQEPNLSAAIVFQFNPNKFLFPLIQSWPILSKSSETLLYKVEGDSILFLNELKHKKNTALNFSLSMTDEDVVAIKAAKASSEGLIEGKDYVGNEVLGFVIKIPNTEWIMVSKTNKKELFSTLYYEMGIVILLVVFLLLFLAAGMAFLYNSRQKSIFRDLYKQQEYYFTTLKSIGDAVISTNKKGIVEYLNPVAEQLTGWLNTEIQGKNLEEIFKIINEETREAVESPVHKVLREGVVVGLANHTLLISKDGREIPIADSGAPIKNEIGEIIGVVLVFRDQTEEREFQEKIAQSEAQYRELVESTDAIAWEYDVEQDNWVYVAPQVTEKLGWLPEEWTNLDFWKNNLHPDERESAANYCFACAAKGEPHALEYRFKSKDGNYIWIRDVVSVEMLGNKPVKLRGVMFDITERKNAEIGLQQKNTFIQTVLDNLPIGVALNKIDEGNAFYMNRKFEEIYGWKASVLKDIASFFEKVYPDENYRNKLIQIIMEGIESGDPNKMHWENIEITRNDGSKGFVNAVNIPLPEQNTMVSTVMDITHRKRVQNELIEAKEKAEESERLKTAFLANMSHEIRTPLNGILGFTNLLAEEDNLSKESKKEFAFIINKSAEGLLKIINDILDISRLETGKADIEQKPFDMGRTLSTIFSIFQKKPTAPGRSNVELIVKKPDKPLVLNTDETRLIQIFSNLLDNALRFTSKGSVTFGISGIKENKAEFFVADTGVGIPKEKHGVIFDRFSQADNSTTRSYGGTGLGLSIVKKLLELMGSEISIESEPGKGTIFRFILPFISFKQTSEDKIEELTTDSIKYNQIKILVVEDDSVSRIYLRQILNNHSGELFFAETGKEALLLFENQNPDVILMDIGLPDMSGLEVVRKIRKKNNNVYIIAQTAYAMAEDKQKALDAGCNDYISKPIKTALLMEKIKQFSN